MAYEEAIKELEWIYQNGFDNDLAIVGTDRILDSIRIAIEVLEKMSALKDGLDSLKKDLQKAYKLNDASLSYVLKGNAMSELECRAEEFSLMMMQDLSWLIDTIEGVE